MLTAREVDSDEALRIGLVSDVVADGLVVERAVELAELLCGYTPFGVEMTKQVMWANLDAPSLEVALHMENRTQILAGTGGRSWRRWRRSRSGRGERPHHGRPLRKSSRWPVTKAMSSSVIPWLEGRTKPNSMI